MTVEERKSVAEAWVKAAKGRLQAVLVHIGGANLRESIELAKHAALIGADAIACVGPTYFKPETMECYVDYMARVAAAAPNLPFYLYDIDFFTGIQFGVTDFFDKAKERIPTLNGVKHTSPHFPSMNTFLLKHPEMQILLGSDELYLPGLAIGITETIMNSYQGAILTQMKESFDKGDMETARKQQKYALTLCNIRRKHDLSVPGGTKAVLRAIGFEVGQPRLPLSPISDDVIQEIKKEMTNVGYFQWGMK
ncbi:hypothetical protein CAPTEDRAFT_219005 [Capitella teleta]|uniref:N-acetylneuraminate lyase n=1 Tax=Capitella teleta TaxID=283909 RepID=R7UKB4_CAPTE|nr:hypothetical protein CAPTEDRAFT_219005 [Capitella teleta]|eukprot:ELU06528.1 hypothetical protein CAPTEDRAFT_219005 [Capitella teleta]